MERLLILRLEAVGCSAEAILNGIPVGRVGKAQAVLSVPVHEFTRAGANDLQLVVNPWPAGEAADPDPEPVLSDGQATASVHLLLPRIGGVVHPAQARTLAQLHWAPAADEVVHMPVHMRQGVELPVNFPRWRWLDAPVLDSATVASKAFRRDLADYLLEIVLGLVRGNADALVRASRLRLEELAVAYQRDLAADVLRLRQHVLQLHAARALNPALPGAARLRLRHIAGGRLVECLSPDGSPLLQYAGDGGWTLAYPVRVAWIDGSFYVLR